MNDKIYCPWCGSVMIYNQCRTTAWYGYFECTNGECRAAAPRVLLHEKTGRNAIDEAAALSAAKHRYQAPNRVLTLEEAHAMLDEGKSVFMELQGIEGGEWRKGELLDRYGWYYSECNDEAYYGDIFRCWLQEPTVTESAAVPWEE